MRGKVKSERSRMEAIVLRGALVSSQRMIAECERETGFNRRDKGKYAVVNVQVKMKAFSNSLRKQRRGNGMA